MNECPYCQATTRQIEAGKTKTGLQIYSCMQCKRKYVPDTAPPEAAPESIAQPTVETRVEEENIPPIPQQILMSPTPLAVGINGGTATLSQLTIPYGKDESVSPSNQVPVDAGRLTDGQAGRSASTYRRWGLLPEITLLQSVGLLLLAWTFVESRAGSTWSDVFFWVGLAILLVPVVIRLYTTETPRYERIALILLLGGAFYMVKLMHSPYAFTFPDEFSHIRNVTEILENQHLFQRNPDLAVTAFYPGLATITSLLVSLSGLSPFAAGVLVIGVARLVLFLGLFLLFEQVSSSARIASLATLIYMANANFLFYTAEFAYESLALPMAILVLYLVARREMTNEHRRALTIVAVFGVLMVVISHHMTTYVLTGFLLAITAITLVLTRGKQRGPWDVALVAVVATSFWLIFVASFTIEYLTPVFSNAISSLFRLVMQEETGRQLFKSTSSGFVSPLWEQLTAFCSLLIILVGLPVGWLEIWRRHRYHIFFVFLGIVALPYLPMQGLRLTSAGWETANRSSEFLFIGVGFVVALAIDPILGFKWVGQKSSWILPAAFTVLFFGGFIAGWAPQARMPRPYLVNTGSQMVEPQNIQVARWTHDYLGPDHRIATSKVGAKLLSAYGEQTTFTGAAHGIKDMLFSSAVGPSEIEIIQKARIEYIASERRLISWDHMIGLFFLNQKSSPGYEMDEVESFEKFDGLQGVNRIMDSGDIVIYDVRNYLKSPLQNNEGLQPGQPAEAAPAPLVNKP